MLGPGNETSAQQTLSAWPNGLQVGGGITDSTAQQWIQQGAEKVIITSFLFPGGHFSQVRLDQCLRALDGDKTKLVIDLSCREKDDSWFVATDKWQRLTTFEISKGKSGRT